MRQRIIMGVVLVVIAIFWVLIAPLLARRLVVERPLENADVILVLSGSAAYKERTKKAAELYKQGVASRIFITNDGERAGWSNTEKRNPPFVELEQRELIANGVPAEAIIILTKLVAGTDEEAKELAKNLDKYSISSVVVVTSAYHSRRAVWTFDKIFDGTGVTIGIEHAELALDPNYWWLRPRGWQMVAGEYVKLGAYYAYY